MLACTRLKEGSGLPLVFLHGFLGTSSDWREVCHFLPAWNCFGIDLPGHGASPFTEDFCSDMPPFDTPIHLVGYSMGGRLAMQYGVRFPKKIASLTVASAHPGLKEKEEKKKRIAIDAEWAKLVVEGDIDEFLKRWYNQPLFGNFLPDLSMRKKNQPELLARCLLHYSLGKQSFLALESVFFIVGEKDEKYRSLLPNAAIVAAAHHMVHLENPKGFAEILKTRIQP